MANTTLHIKNMVCDRCKAAVRTTIEGCQLKPLSVDLGVAVIEGSVDDATLQQVSSALQRQGFELLGDRREQTVDAIRSLIIKLVHQQDSRTHLRLSDFLVQELHADYSSLSKLFSESTGSTIENFYVRQRIERVKELLSYGELTLSQIAVKLNYSSTAYLSAQFKQVTGMTPTAYKSAQSPERRALDQL